MINPPRTIQQAMKRTYGFHPHEAYDVTQCAYEVIDPKFGPRQCFNRRGHGPAGLYCAQHGAAQEPTTGKSERATASILDHAMASLGRRSQ